MADAPVSGDDAKGRVKEAAGSLTGNDELKAKGERDQTVEKVKDTVGKLAEKVEDILHKKD